MQIQLRTILLILITLGFISLFWISPAWTPATAQQPTGSIPTVTGTAPGPFITVTSVDGANVRSGPSTFDYPAVGHLVTGETAPAMGRSPGGDWIEIIYLGVPGGIGWVYAPLVSLSSGGLQILEPPPTATPLTTPTLNPTFVAAFPIQSTPTLLPTFTSPPPLATLNFTPVAGGASHVPMGFIIIGLALIGVLVAIFSFLRGR